jgi:hypothetical protein
MERAAMDHVESMLKEEVTTRFPGAAIQQVLLLQYGDEPVIEPGEMLVRVTIESGGSKAEREQALEAFHQAHREAIEKFREDLDARLPEARRLEFTAAGGNGHGPRIMMHKGGRQLEARAAAGVELTPVMARLAPADLETLDTLITAGIAPNRAEAVRWALARIRDRPAYEQIRTRAQEIEELKAQF